MTSPRVVVLICADAEWAALEHRFPALQRHPSPYGPWFQVPIPVGGEHWSVVFFHGGWGKIASAGGTQYAIDRWQPDLLVNLGTCGGFSGHVNLGDIILVEKALAYDILEQIGQPEAALAHYTTVLDLSWLREPYPMPVRRALMVSGDRDLVPADVPRLHARFGAVVGDWESAAVAYVARRNGVRCLILRGVSDLVGPEGGEVYGRPGTFWERAQGIMNRLVDHLGDWLCCAQLEP